MLILFILYCGYIGVTVVLNGENFSSITAVAVVMGTKHCERVWNKDDFLSPCSSLVSVFNFLFLVAVFSFHQLLQYTVVFFLN